MHYILLPFSSCLSDLSPSTDYIFLSPPPLLPVFLSPFSLLSPIPRTYLSYFSHSSGISQAFLTLSQTLSKSEITKSDKKKKQAAGNPSSQKNIGSDKSNTRKQAGTNNGQEAQGRYRAIQDNTRLR